MEEIKQAIEKARTTKEKAILAITFGAECVSNTRLQNLLDGKPFAREKKTVEDIKTTVEQPKAKPVTVQVESNYIVKGLVKSVGFDKQALLDICPTVKDEKGKAKRTVPSAEELANFEDAEFTALIEDLKRLRVSYLAQCAPAILAQNANKKK